MALADLFEDFGREAGAAPPSSAAFVPVGDPAAVRAAAYEEGFRAGREAALADRERERERAARLLAEHLLDASFSFNEAVSQLLARLEPVFARLIDAVLPELLARSFAQHVVDALMSAAREALTVPVEIVVPEGMAAAVQALLPPEPAMDLRLREEPDLAPLQARLRVGEAETELDGARLLREVGDIFASFLDETRETLADGSNG